MKYEKRGVSAGKEEVHAAIRGIDKGLYPNAFCKVLPDLAGADERFCNIMHADTAGTKAALAYLYWKETGDLSVWEGIVQDAIVMNLDDIACTGLPDSIIFSNTIGRNKNLIPGDVLKTLIQGTEKLLQQLRDNGINAVSAGGETADVGDLVRTIDVGFTAFARLPRKDITEINIKPGNVIVSLASFGQTNYESMYNSGIGSNGLTFARHEVLSNEYAKAYPETYDPAVEQEMVYSGSRKLTDHYRNHELNVGQMLLSPTRTYAPFLQELFSEGIPVNGIIHCTGGGLSKVLHFIDNCHVIKDNPFDVPPVFDMIREENKTPWKEMYRVFNMGQRLEIYLEEKYAEQLIDMAEKWKIDARLAGRCEEAGRPKVSVTTPDGIETYE